ncbi:Dihydrolipoamide acetyltransferase component of pyruvate dehydrogenase complex [Trichostrongylus colubriformis]|uniref:Dihydrolipoamide acetyltransferase component of pyruvate dehydrogenase complex n=1 Tax=Trichostrongylus colubriformis TaxID=6319 RepID=A0AAN8G2W4_TRICO
MLSIRAVPASVRCLTTASHSQSGLCGPAVRLLMLQYGINEKDVKATGPKGNIMKSDVLGFVKTSGLKPVVVKVAPPPEPAAAATPSKPGAPQKTPTKPIGSVRHVEKFVDIPLSNERVTVAKKLVQTKQSIPHGYQSAIVHADAIIAIQAELKAKGVEVSLNDFIIKAAALALRAVPEVNVRFSSESQLTSLPMVDISVAFGSTNLVVKSADILGVQDISVRVKDLANRASENKLQPDECQGGSFTVSYLGMFDSVEQFTAIINPPQSATLTVGRTAIELDENFEPRNRFTATLCFDARAITETSARLFLDHFAASLSDPDFMVAEPISPELNFDFARLL